MQMCKRQYRYYCLGMALHEICLWFPLLALMHEHGGWCQSNAKAFAESTRKEYCPQLGSSIGAAYQDVVADLLDARLNEKSLGAL